MRSIACGIGLAIFGIGISFYSDPGVGEPVNDAMSSRIYGSFVVLVNDEVDVDVDVNPHNTHQGKYHDCGKPYDPAKCNYCVGANYGGCGGGVCGKKQIIEFWNARGTGIFSKKDKPTKTACSQKVCPAPRKTVYCGEDVAEVVMECAKKPDTVPEPVAEEDVVFDLL